MRIIFFVRKPCKEKPFYTKFQRIVIDKTYATK